MLPVLVLLLGGYVVYKKYPVIKQTGQKLISTSANVGVKVGNYVNLPNASIETIAKTLAKSKLKVSEGYRNDVYIDTEGYLTVGIGHKVLASDNLKFGQKISDERVNQLFEQDVSKAFSAALSQARELGHYKADFIAALTEVNFQLGTGWKDEFKNTYAALKGGNYMIAVNNLIRSKWNRQTPDRVSNFINAIQKAYSA